MRLNSSPGSYRCSSAIWRDCKWRYFKLPGALSGRKCQCQDHRKASALPANHRCHCQLLLGVCTHALPPQCRLVVSLLCGTCFTGSPALPNALHILERAVCRNYLRLCSFEDLRGYEFLCPLCKGYMPTLLAAGMAPGPSAEGTEATLFYHPG